MEYRCVTDLAKLQDYLGGARLVAFDFETAPREEYRKDEKAALDAHKADIAGVSFSVSEGTAVYVPLRHKTGRNTGSPDKVMQWLAKSVFENKEIVKIAHNLSFEAMFLYALGIVLQPPCYDTIAAAQMTLKSNTAFRTLSDSGLKTLVQELFGAELPSFETVTAGRYFDELDPQDEETVRYACADSDYALRLYHLFNGWFDRYLPKHRFIVEKLESPAAVYCGLMKHNGLLADEELMLKKQAEAEERIKQLKEEIAFMTGDVNIGANASTSAFKKYLYEDLKLPVFKTTAKYQEAMDDEAMILLSEWCRENRPELAALFELVQEYRRWGKIKSTYIDGYLEHINSVTGRIHPDLFPLGTETGRFAARNPNCNCPRKEIGVRNFFIAPKGKALLSLDFSQIELRVGAFYCRDGRMLETYRTGGDIHAQTTSVIYRIPFEEASDKRAEHYKERRAIAKNCNFGVFYGLFPKGLQRNLKFKAGLDTPLSECERIIENLKSGYPRLARGRRKQKRAASRRYTETWLGRRRYRRTSLPPTGAKELCRAVRAEYPDTGTAADILKLALGRIIEGLPQRMWLRPVLQIHDELVFEVPEGRCEAAAFIKACMEERPLKSLTCRLLQKRHSEQGLELKK